VDATDLAFAGLARQAELVRAGAVSSRELTELYLARIERLDPLVRAYRVVLTEEALAAADAADAAVASGAAGPLCGVPVAVKDDTDVAGQLTARGSFAHGPAASADAELVARLRSAGAVILGKTHVPELEALAVTESLSFGATRNPWDLTRTPGGSSGGSGAAVAAGLAAAAQGTDGVGSIRIPAGCCGLFGLKPQRGRLPLQNGFGGLAVAGALTRDVLDSALFLDAVAGTDLAAAARRAPGALRIAYSLKLPRGVMGRLDDEPREAVERTVEHLRALGHTVEQRDPDFGNAALSVVARYLHAVRSEADAMAHPERLSRRTRGIAALGRGIPGPLVQRALGQEAADRDRVGVLLREFDVLLSPLLTRRPPPVGEWEGLPAPVALSGMAHFTAFLGFWNHTGQPAAAVPVEQAADGFPVGVQLIGRPDDEATLLSLSAQLESATSWPSRRPPLAT
jgi:amidase